MADNQNVGSGPESGPAGAPNQPESPEASQPIGGEVNQLLAALENKFSAKFSQLESRMGGMREVQSRIDTAQSDFQKQLARLESYEKQGLSREEAILEMQSDDAANARWQTLEQKLDALAARLQSGGTQTNGQQQVAKVFESLGLDLKDPRVATALVNPYTNADEVELAAYRLQRQIQQSPNPNPAQSPSLTGGEAQAVNYDALAAEYDRLSVDPAANFERMSQIRQELDKIK